MSNLKAMRERLRKNAGEWYRLCYHLGLTASQLRNKLYNPGRFTLYEIVRIKGFFGLSLDETIKIFAPNVANCN